MIETNNVNINRDGKFEFIIAIIRTIKLKKSIELSNYFE